MARDYAGIVDRLQTMLDTYRRTTGETPGCWVMAKETAQKVAREIVVDMPANYQPKTMILLGLPVVLNQIAPADEILLVSRQWYLMYGAGENGAS